MIETLSLNEAFSLNEVFSPVWANSAIYLRCLLSPSGWWRAILYQFFHTPGLAGKKVEKSRAILYQFFHIPGLAGQKGWKFHNFSQILYHKPMVKAYRGQKVDKVKNSEKITLYP